MLFFLYIVGLILFFPLILVCLGVSPFGYGLFDCFHFDLDLFGLRTRVRLRSHECQSGRTLGHVEIFLIGWGSSLGHVFFVF